MSERIKRIRVFAGPNGSGKTTLYNYLIQINAFHTYYHINPDMIMKDLNVSLNLDNWPIDFSYFSFESVFSHATKIQEMESAKKENFKVYLYFITTSNPLINLQRVRNRVENGGHDVPDDKIHDRYFKTLNNLYRAFKLADKAYFFDNSKEKTNGSFDFFAEKNGKQLFLSDPDSIPEWFGKYIMEPLSNE